MSREHVGRQQGPQPPRTPLRRRIQGKIQGPQASEAPDFGTPAAPGITDEAVPRCVS